jgi:hypothetical protein
MIQASEAIERFFRSFESNLCNDHAAGNVSLFAEVFIAASPDFSPTFLPERFGGLARHFAVVFKDMRRRYLRIHRLMGRMGWLAR